MTTQTYSSNPVNNQLVIEKITKLNAKAAKKGIDQVIDYSLGEIEYVPVKENGKITHYTQSQTITISRRQPLFNGWKFLGKIDYSLGKGIINGNDSIPEKYRESCFCEHCNTYRHRNLTYVLQNQSGQFINVGSICIQDFLEIQIDPYISTFFADIDVDNFGGSSAPMYSIIDLIAAGKLIADKYGFVSKKQALEKDIDATAWLVGSYFNYKEFYQLMGNFNQSHIDFANIVIDHILAKDSTNNQYISNLQIMFNAKFVEHKFINYVVSAIGYYLADIEKQIVKTEYAKGFIGAIKDKIVANVKIELIKPIESSFGVSFLVKMRDDQNHCLTWFASNCPDFDVDDVVTIKATIKATQTWQNIDQTVVTRAKKVK